MKHDDGGPALSPCPFGCDGCNPGDDYIPEVYIVEKRETGGPWYWVECEDGCRGPERGREEHAVLVWNAVADAMLRARLAEQAGEGESDG